MVPFDYHNTTTWKVVEASLIDKIEATKLRSCCEEAEQCCADMLLAEHGILHFYSYRYIRIFLVLSQITYVNLQINKHMITIVFVYDCKYAHAFRINRVTAIIANIDCINNYRCRGRVSPHLGWLELCIPADLAQHFCPYTVSSTCLHRVSRVLQCVLYHTE